MPAFFYYSILGKSAFRDLTCKSFTWSFRSTKRLLFLFFYLFNFLGAMKNHSSQVKRDCKKQLTTFQRQPSQHWRVLRCLHFMCTCIWMCGGSFLTRKGQLHNIEDMFCIVKMTLLDLLHCRCTGGTIKTCMEKGKQWIFHWRLSLSWRGPLLTTTGKEASLSRPLHSRWRSYVSHWSSGHVTLTTLMKYSEIHPLMYKCSTVFPYISYSCSLTTLGPWKIIFIP